MKNTTYCQGDKTQGKPDSMAHLRLGQPLISAKVCKLKRGKKAIFYLLPAATHFAPPFIGKAFFSVQAPFFPIEQPPRNTQST
jgi:hypothetical protein